MSLNSAKIKLDTKQDPYLAMSPINLQRRSFTASRDPAVDTKVSAACLAYEAKNFAEALAILLPVASDPAAQCFLGMVYLDDPDRVAMRESGWNNLIASAEAGYEYAWHVLGNRYLNLETNKFNLEQASRWLMKSAELGCITSQYSLGWCLCKLENYIEATKWLFLAVALGNSNAASLCESVSVNMTPEEYEHGYQLALKWLDFKEREPTEMYYAPLRAYIESSLPRIK